MQRFIMVVLIATLTITVSADEKFIAPTHIPGTTVITAEALIELVATTPWLVLIDSRYTADRKQGYIEGSISLQNTDTTCASLAKHVSDHSRPIAFYCNGIHCTRSTQASRIAVSCGYKNIYWFRKGFDEWVSKQYPFAKQ